MASVVSARATLDDLYRVEGKAELIGGRIVHFMSSGYDPSRVAFEIAVSLRLFAQVLGTGRAFPDGIGYALSPPLSNGRQSFSPNASYDTGPLPANRMRFIERAPDFAVEVRSEGDYGPAAEAARQAKRADYFEAGTLVVWDVNPQGASIACYRENSSEPAAVSWAGQIAEAEPAVPGWTLALDELFS